MTNNQSNQSIINNEVSTEFPQKLKEPDITNSMSIKMTSNNDNKSLMNKDYSNHPKDVKGEPIHFKYYWFACRYGLQHDIQTHDDALVFCKYIVDKYPNWVDDDSWKLELEENTTEPEPVKKKKTRRGGKKKKTTSPNNNKTDSITAVSLRYKNFIETKYDQAFIHSAKASAEGWARAKAAAPPIAWEEQPQTKWVRKFATDFVNDRFKDIKIHDAIKVTIQPIALNNHCHHNAKFYSQHLAECEAVFGYNVFSCKCGKRIECEAHSINKVKGKYVDFTEDYDGEKTKWFIPINTNGQSITNEAITLKNDARDGYREIDTLHSNRGCKCIAYKNSKMFTEVGKTPIDKKLVEAIKRFWEQ